MTDGLFLLLVLAGAALAMPALVELWHGLQIVGHGIWHVLTFGAK